MIAVLQRVSEACVRVDGQVVSDPLAEVREFNRVELDDQLLQAGRRFRNTLDDAVAAGGKGEKQRKKDKMFHTTTIV